MILTLLLLLWLLGFALFWRVPVCRPGAKPARAQTISVIIPARDEEHNIGRLLQSIRSGGAAPIEVLVVDDGSGDRTAEVARQSGAVVVDPGTPPEGWRGKTWACQQGARAAKGSVLLFLDADTWVLPDGLARMAGEFERRGLAVLSLGPYHETERVYEQASSIFNLTTFMGIGAFGILDSVERPGGLFGPCLLVDREAYWRAGGHEKVRGEILEHMSLAPILIKAGASAACLGGRGVVHTRMYPDGLKSLVEGWTKAFATGAAKTSRLRLLLIVGWIFGSLFSVLDLALGPWIGWTASGYGLVYLAFAFQWVLFLGRVGRFSFGTSLLFPLPLLFFFAVFSRSALLRVSGGRVVWKGRSIASGG